MRVLLSNDDGVYAEGIKVLYEAVSSVAETHIVAPLEERSTTSHTLSVDHPLRLQKIKENIWGCSGYPADCALIGTAHVLQGRPIDLLISGINKGGNLGSDVYYSGTVAAARQAAFHGTRSIAVSLEIKRGEEGKLYYSSAATVIKHLIDLGLYKNIPVEHVLNINVPNLPLDKIKGIEMTTLGKRIYEQKIEERKDFRGRNYYWIAGSLLGHENIEGSDCTAIDQGKISMSLLNLFSTSSNIRVEWSSIVKDLERAIF